VEQVLASPHITLRRINPPFHAPASPLNPDLLARVERLTAEMWPGAIVVPSMGTGATDSRWLRAAGIPSYGVSGLFFAESRAHGRDERIGVRDLYAGRQFLHRLITELAAAP
jgi:acetylornithine deacetylase/succinyl-diaminopimelate desuccinylase-like protein